jgi:glycosyltransferase involved in cell wall biosynthesis
MRVLIISCVYPPEPVVSAQTSADLARALAERGHAVTVVTTFPNRPAGEVYPGYSRRLFRRMPSASGVAVLRCFALLSPRSRLLSRLLENLSFGVTGCIAVLLQPRPDVIYANTWPIIATGLLCLAARLRRIPVVVSLQDVYPESLVVQGRLRPESRAARLLQRMDTAIAQSAAGLVAISPSFAALYQATRQVPPGRIAVVPNWIDRRAIDPDDARAATVRGEFGIPADARLVVYGGNIGVAAGVETLIAAFHLLVADHLHLLIAGEGSQLDHCRQQARETSAGAVSFCTPWLKADTSRILAAADVLVLPTRGQQSLASVPSKLISYMLTARPIIALADRESDLARVVETAGCGWIVPPDQPAALAERLRAVKSLPAAELERRGRAGRGYALEYFVSDTCLPMVVRVVEQSAARP